MLGGEDDIAVVRSLDCGGGSDKWESGFVEPEETGNSKEMGRFGVTASELVPTNEWLLILEMRVLPG